ncbi:MAG TPA: hypothetical protein VK435_11365 [Thermodesulfovibrionales bacterium]|nr:hypothetical protein [Thermodesulfovibrionales bacterium]
MNELRNERGSVKVIFTLAFVVLCVYVGLKIGTPYYRYSVFKSDAREIARVGLGDISRTKTMLVERAQELKLPIGEEDISVNVTNKTVLINTSWAETVDFFGVYQKELDFSVNIEE